VRNVVQNVNDLKAQIAANEKGVRELRKMVAQFGLDVVQAYMGHVQDNAAESVRRVLDRLHDSEFTVAMDRAARSGAHHRRPRQARGHGRLHRHLAPAADNFNAPAPVTRAAVLYVFRVMVDDDIPMNAGCLRPIRIVIPPGSMLAPRYPAAVVAGNVEVSQVVTNCLFGALKAMSASQGTMNNLTFGNDVHQYYETICSGSPAGPGFDGTPGVHVHMTNSRLTDPRCLSTASPCCWRTSTSGRARAARAVERRRRHQPHHPLPRDDGLRDPLGLPPRAPLRHRRRRTRRDRPDPGAPAGRHRGGHRRLQPDGPARGRGRHRHHPHRRRVR
jgi:5-oxoprolinase (ATP-hydrolysing)